MYDHLHDRTNSRKGTVIVLITNNRPYILFSTTLHGGVLDELVIHITTDAYNSNRMSYFLSAEYMDDYDHEKLDAELIKLGIAERPDQQFGMWII